MVYVVRKSMSVVKRIKNSCSPAIYQPGVNNKGKADTAIMA